LSAWGELSSLVDDKMAGYDNLNGLFQVLHQTGEAGHILWSIKMFILAHIPHTSETILVFLLPLIIKIRNNGIVCYTSSSTI
jgi:hypothetical protein